MITRCPTCLTAFRVSRTQLAARDGQVRCGACAHVFDAVTHLLVDAPVVAAEPVNATAEAGDTLPVIWSELDIAPVKTSPSLVPVASTEQEGNSKPEPEALLVTTPAPKPKTAASELDFGPPPSPPRHRGSWIATSLLLLLLLVAQCLFHFRSDIALLVPESKPLFAKACAMLECALSLPQRSELMSIEASDLQADGANPNVVILTATLRNRAAFAQANPALELTLTDAQDLPLARRVLRAGDYLDTAPDNDAGFAAGAERAIRITMQLTDIKATGYRLYLFYP